MTSGILFFFGGALDVKQCGCSTAVGQVLIAMCSAPARSRQNGMPIMGTSLCEKYPWDGHDANGAESLNL